MDSRLYQQRPYNDFVIAGIGLLVDLPDNATTKIFLECHSDNFVFVILKIKVNVMTTIASAIDASAAAVAVGTKHPPRLSEAEVSLDRK